MVRPYHRGGAVARLLRDRYLRIGTPRPIREYRLGRMLEAAGLPTPTHIGAAVYPSGPWYRGDLVTLYVPESRDLAEVLFEGTGEEGGAAMLAAGQLLRILHEKGLDHPDLNLKNILISSSPATAPALVLDLDRARLRRHLSARRRRRMLDRFWRSAAKWEARTGTVLGRNLWEAFEGGYGGSGGRTD